MITKLTKWILGICRCHGGSDSDCHIGYDR